jgi:alanyl-tRNA synthetase
MNRPSYARDMNWPVSKVRSTFIEYFVKKHAHVFVPSSPSVPLEDPTLLFTNAGMNQFKPIFLGQVDPASPMSKWKRAANSQKCIRAGGKHNDLEDVGKDTYHHTLFEMLGNWSFGDYFKKEAVEWSFDLLANVYGLDPKRMYATYFEGNPSQGLPPDEETRDLWLKYLPADHVLPGNMKDNFWEMGDTGPCGPCTEIHYDRIGGRNARAMVNQSDPDVIEIWNNVFIQFNREADRSLRPLPAKHVDTGMGLERITSILQNVRSNYDTDVFAPIFLKIEQLTGARSYEGKLGEKDKDNVDTAYRVIADHIRTLTFAITDGAVPSNVGRGYVLRRILRRAVRYGRQMLGAKTGFFADLVPTVVHHFGDAFPELRKAPDKVQAIIREEEESFGRTLDRGIKLFDEVAQAASSTSAKTISGSDAFKLYDTFGFPVDLTMLMASERGLLVDEAGYKIEEEKAKELSRTGGKQEETKGLVLSGESVARLKHMNVQATDDSAKFESKHLRAHVKAIWNGHNFDDHTHLHMGSVNKLVGIVLDKTNFYATMGGQEGDTGEISVLSASASHSGEFEVESTQVFGGYVLHIGRVQKGALRVGDTVQLKVHASRRAGLQRNHTATHLANWALREVLGDDVNQKGSLVAPDRFRFDFSHNQPVEPSQIARIEQLVQSHIAINYIVHAEPVALANAKAIASLRAVFGEAYPDPVRVVAIGVPVEDLVANPASSEWKRYSIELCGGTHVLATREIEHFALLSEEGVAKGVRRITAVTGAEASTAHAAGEALAKKISEAKQARPEQLQPLVTELVQQLDTAVIPSSRKALLREQIAGLQEQLKQMSKQLSAQLTQRVIQQAKNLAQSAVANSSNVVVAQVEAGDDRNALQSAVKTVRDTLPGAAVMLFAVDDAGKAMMHASVPDAAIAKGLKAGAWLRDAAAAMGGKGGGKDDNAQGGAPDGKNVRDAMRVAEQAALKLMM